MGADLYRRIRSEIAEYLKSVDKLPLKRVEEESKIVGLLRALGNFDDECIKELLENGLTILSGSIALKGSLEREGREIRRKANVRLYYMKFPEGINRRELCCDKIRLEDFSPETRPLLGTKIPCIRSYLTPCMDVRKEDGVILACTRIEVLYRVFKKSALPQEQG